MHDKYIIADNNIVIIGGRNIGDKYFAPEWYNEKITNDRDIIIINSKPKDPTSVIYQMSEYFDSIWNHKYSQPINKEPIGIQYKKAIEKIEELKRKSRKAREINKDLFEKPIDLMKISFPTNKILYYKMVWIFVVETGVFFKTH